MLVKMAKQYHRPLLTFYLSGPPRKGDRGVDYRTLPAGYSAIDDARVDALVRDLQARQSIIRAAIEDEDEAEVLPFVDSMRMSDGWHAVLESLQELLDVELELYYRQQDASVAFGLLRESVEQLGVFVLMKGDLGSYHTAMGTDVFRGLVIADEVAPLITINDQDGHSAWSFTLVHELVHLILGQTGIDGAIEEEKEVEQFCNNVAGEFLLPAHRLDALRLPHDSDLESTEYRISEFANEHNLSRTMVAYKAYRTSLIGFGVFQALSNKFRQQWAEQRDTQRAMARNQDSGPTYYTVRRHRIGQGLIGFVQRMIAAGALSTSKASRILDVSPTKVHRLLDPTRSS